MSENRAPVSHGRGQQFVKCVGIGTTVGVLLSQLIAVVRLIGGAEVFRSMGAEPLRLVAAYVGLGAFGGVLCALLGPIAVRPVGAALLGWLICALFGFILRTGEIALVTWRFRDTALVLTFGACLGIPVGLMYREIFSDDPPDGGRPGDRKRRRRRK